MRLLPITRCMDCKHFHRGLAYPTCHHEKRTPPKIVESRSPIPADCPLEEAEVRREVVLVLSDDRSWDGLYVGGRLVKEADTLYALDALQECGVPFRLVYVTLPDDDTLLPDTLAEAEKWKADE